ncbi:MAG: DNA helicase, partial [Actinomycetes bacterium]
MGTTADLALGDVVAPRPAVSVEITSTPVLSYALAHNRVPVVSRLAITNLGGPVRAATVRLGVRDAEGAIARPVELLADLDEGRTTVLTDLGLVMDPAAMLHVEDQRPGVLEVEVEATTDHGAVLLGEGSRAVQVLAAQQWLATPVPLALEMLAAHVMPNHPAVTALVSEAAGVLERRTGSGALVGYAATPERVDEVVSAIAETMRSRGIRHSEPPLSWSDLGQQVRTPGDVLTWLVGTPLDTVVLLAAALEQAGIRPLLWLAEGHSFLGYWREERSAESAATT